MKICARVSVLLLLCMMCGLLSASWGKKTAASPDLRSIILDELEKITTYEMDVIYSESVEDRENDVTLQSNCRATIKFAEPRRLYIDAVGTTNAQSGGSKQNQTIRIYTTFDGRFQKARYSSEANGQASTNSIVLDMSINSPETPFNGWNLKGFGLLEGKDYIGTIKTLIDQYDFQKSHQEDSIATFTGTFNVERAADMLSKSMPKERARRFAERVAESRKAFSILIDTTRNLAVGFTLRDAFGEAVATRKCRFEDIMINWRIDPAVFVFKPLPNEKFTDITDGLRENRRKDNP